MVLPLIIVSVALLAALGVILYFSRSISSLRADHAVEMERQRAAAEANMADAVEARTELAQVRSEMGELKSELEESRARLNDSRTENARLSERLAILDKQRQERMAEDENRFKALAADILNANSRIFKEQHEQTLEKILSPLRSNIDEFKKCVTECYDKESRERLSLATIIRELQAANQTLGTEARQLTEALRGDSKVQGDWGEIILEGILERSGLRKDEEYFVQQTRHDDGRTIRNEEGTALRPDVVVRFPEGRVVVIDSKMSLTAFVDYVNAEDEASRREALDRHLRSVRSHVKELERKEYQDYLGDQKLDFVMMFVPNEGAYTAAMQADSKLWQDAYDRRVLIVSPTHLVSALKLIEQLWVRDRQTKNAIAIADAAGSLYDKFVGFVADIEGIGKGMATSQKAYDAALNKLRDGRGNLIGAVEKLRDLGAKAKKRLAISNSED